MIATDCFQTKGAGLNTFTNTICYLLIRAKVSTSIKDVMRPRTIPLDFTRAHNLGYWVRCFYRCRRWRSPSFGEPRA